MEEDAVVLHDRNSSFLAIEKPVVSKFFESEKEVAETVYNFLANWGPHRYYPKAYTEMFEKIASCHDWRNNTPLVGLYKALKNERRRYCKD